MTRRRGRLVVLTRDGQRIWGSADAAFTEGLPGAGCAVDPDEATVLPLRRRPADGGPLEDALGGDGGRMQLGRVVWALLAHRDFLRRQAA